MPQAVIAAPAFWAAVAGGAGAVGAAALESRSRNKASSIEQKNADAALAYQKDRQGVEDARYAQRWGAYQDYVKDWKARNGYGASTQASGAGSSGVAPSGLSLASLGGASLQPMPGAAPAAADQAQGNPTLADVSKWNDWRNYGTA